MGGAARLMARTPGRLWTVDPIPPWLSRRSLGLLVLALLLCIVGCVPAPSSTMPVPSTMPTAAATATAVPAVNLGPYPWVYLRNGEALAEAEDLVTIIAVGDVLVGRGVTSQPDPLRYTAAWLPAADLVLGNLEGVLVDQGVPRTARVGEAQPIILGTVASAAVQLAAAGFDILGLANNHSLDYGEQGLEDTVAHLQQVGVATIGTVADRASGQPLVREIDGLRLAFFAYTAVPDPEPESVCPPPDPCMPHPVAWDPDTSPQEIATARARADAVVVSIHWGYEYQTRPDPSQEAIADVMLAAGADLVVGHHPHVAQRLFAEGEQFVAYSLGNFLFDQSEGMTSQGLALRAFFDKEGLRAVQALPLAAGILPRLLPLSEAQSWLDSLLPPPPARAFVCNEDGCVPAEAPPAAQTGPFYSGQIDLTGDGRPEIIRRVGERITIYEQGKAVWQSPKEWRVVDVALGDANDDGRYELLLALWQDDTQGYARSQPYIVGHRGGRYRLLWGGRPVADPIQDVALGDIDGNGNDELVVIEQMAGGPEQAVSVWRWAGWTFSLLWRSPYGRYVDLQLLEHNGRTFIVVATP